MGGGENLSEKNRIGKLVDKLLNNEGKSHDLKLEKLQHELDNYEDEIEEKLQELTIDFNELVKYISEELLKNNVEISEQNISLILDLEMEFLKSKGIVE